MVDEYSTIAEQIDAFKRERNPGVVFEEPTESPADREACLVADNPPGALAAGASLPEAALLDVNGDATTLSDALGGRPSVLIFYRGNWCPNCNIALRAYQHQLQPALRDAGVNLIAISPQTPDGSLTAAEKFDLQFTVLSDPGNALTRELGILKPTDPDAAAKATVDVGSYNADGTWDVPYPATVIVDARGVIRFIDVRVDHTTRTESSTILDVVRGLTG